MARSDEINNVQYFGPVREFTRLRQIIISLGMKSSTTRKILILKCTLEQPAPQLLHLSFQYSWQHDAQEIPLWRGNTCDVVCFKSALESAKDDYGILVGRTVDFQQIMMSWVVF